MDPKEQFYRQFQAELAGIQAEIRQLGSAAVAQGARKAATDSILAKISKLTLEVADAAEIIPAYDQRTYSLAVKALTDQLNGELARLAPAKPRFQFKRPAKAAAGPAAAPPSAKPADPRLLRGVPDHTPVGPSSPTASQHRPGSPSTSSQTGAPPVPPPAPAAAAKDYNTALAAEASSGAAGIRRPSFSAAREIALAGHAGLHIALPLSAAHATASGSVTGLRGCVVDMSVPTASRARGGGGAPFQSLMLRDMERSLVVAGHVQGPVHATGLRRCVLVVAARQVRIHECHAVDVYLQCGSRPIIEDCAAMRFAPLPSTFADADEAEGAAPKPNLWDQVDDFKWLRSDASPNWSVLPDSERLPEAVWAGIASGGGGAAGQGTEAVLRSVGLGK